MNLEQLICAYVAFLLFIYIYIYIYKIRMAQLNLPVKRIDFSLPVYAGLSSRIVQSFVVQLPNLKIQSTTNYYYYYYY